MSGYAAKDLLGFLDYALDKGLGKKETLKTRIVSVGRIVDVVGVDEFADVREVDTDHIMERFVNLEGTKFSPGSLASYKSRLNSTISDFLRWKENPSNYRPKGQRASRPKVGGSEWPEERVQNANPDLERSHKAHNDVESTGTGDVSTFPIPLRQGLIVKLVGLPHDLTQHEAQRIANIVKAMAILEE